MPKCETMSGEELGLKLLESVRQMKAGQAARITRFEQTDDGRMVATTTNGVGEVLSVRELPMAAEARHRVGVSQAEFAALMGVSVRTVQDWEQGRRTPTGAAQTLLRVAVQHPDALRDLR